MINTNDALLSLLDPPFPLLYNGILNGEKHFQMSKSRLSKECCICERPFTVFTWRLNGVPYKTYICQICARVANICQVSLLDLDIGIPVAVRNRLLMHKTKQSKTKYRLWHENRTIDRKIQRGEEWFDSSLRDQVLNLDESVVKRVRQIVEQDPYLMYRKSPVCPEWLNSECLYGDTCYFRHKLPDPGEISPDWSKYGVRCRYLGTEDPNGAAVIEKLLNIDNSFFPKQQKDESKLDPSLAVPMKPALKVEEIKSIMTVPEEIEEIFTQDRPSSYPNLPAPTKVFPKLVSGKLQQR